MTSGALSVKLTRPILEVSNILDSVIVDGIPFMNWFSGDDFRNNEIPFHHIPDYFQGGLPPVPSERVDVAIVGGGLSGLATAYLLRQFRPVVFELRDRFGGNSQGEQWSEIPYSLGGAYFITPDDGSFLQQFYTELGLDRVVRVSDPPDPVEVYGRIRNDFWSGGGLPEEEQVAMKRYADVVAYMANEAYPEIPLSADPKERARVLSLDQVDFRKDLEARMGMPLTPFLHAGVQGYFYSSFGAAMEEISAASGWNFVAAEEFGRWVLPGGNSYMVQELWQRLHQLEQETTAVCPNSILRGRCRVIDVRPYRDNVQVTYSDANGQLQSVEAKHVVMAGPKHVCKHILYDLRNRDLEKFNAISLIPSHPYLVANVLLDAPISRDFYDIFLVGDETFPANPQDFLLSPRVTDVIRGDFANPVTANHGVLTLFWPLPWSLARFTLIQNEPWQRYAELLVPQLRHVLNLLNIADGAVRQVRMTRWGHAMPLAHPNLIASGICEKAAAPLGKNIRFVNQDNWSLPAVENCLLDAQRVAEEIAELL
jgi:hypothetical protein